jgi:hypothetical protein
MAHRRFPFTPARQRILCCLCVFPLTLGTLPAQTVTASTPTRAASQQSSTTHNPYRHKKRRKTHRLAKAVAPLQPAPVVAPAPVQQPAAPAWPIPPVQQPAEPPTVILNGDQLTIVAKNSSLQAILDAVSKQTGLKVTGLSGDVRVYGSYGPGTVSRTLNALLQGSQYNYVLVGGDANHPPKELDFSLSH